VAGAGVLELFGDVVTEIAIITDGDEGLFVGYVLAEPVVVVRAVGTTVVPVAHSRTRPALA